MLASVTTSARAMQQVAEARRFIASGEARQLREALRLSLMDVAPTVLADPSAIGRWERGERTPRGPVAVKYVRLLRRLQSQLEATCPPAA
ncbi:hypothetical protein DQ244_06140 [Blastococcus sp. TBT05-19]|nr:hypothetical protein DQ244_06140 [Blastococcus sp. TBT05-19]